MKLSWKHVRTLLGEVPQQAKLTYCLLRDERVPRQAKLALVGALALVLSPIDLPAWLPVFGELDMLALALLAVATFIEACPDDVVDDHRRALRRGESLWHADRRAGLEVVRDGAARVAVNWRARLRQAG